MNIFKLLKIFRWISEKALVLTEELQHLITLSNFNEFIILGWRFFIWRNKFSFSRYRTYKLDIDFSIFNSRVFKYMNKTLYAWILRIMNTMSHDSYKFCRNIHIIHSNLYDQEYGVNGWHQKNGVYCTKNSRFSKISIVIPVFLHFIPISIIFHHYQFCFENFQITFWTWVMHCWKDDHDMWKNRVDWKRIWWWKDIE